MHLPEIEHQLPPFFQRVIYSLYWLICFGSLSVSYMI